MANDYHTYYRGELMDIIKQTTINAIRNAYSNTNEAHANDCPLKARLQGIFDMADGIMKQLADDVEG